MLYLNIVARPPTWPMHQAPTLARGADSTAIGVNVLCSNVFKITPDVVSTFIGGKVQIPHLMRYRKRNLQGISISEAVAPKDCHRNSKVLQGTSVLSQWDDLSKPEDEDNLITENMMIGVRIESYICTS
jgi:hypothetical protein